MSHVLLAARDDAADLRGRILALLADEDVTIDTNLTLFPASEEPTVVLVVLSDAALTDPFIASFVREASRRFLPIIPVVEDRDSYDFTAVRIPQLVPLNAVGWQPGDGQAVLATVRGYLGREVFPRQRRVFLSYRRQDGDAIAQSLRRDLRDHDYDVFRDVDQIEGGAVVQDRIMEEITGKDFVLLIDTPAARESSWVEAEIVEALSQRIPVRALSVDQADDYPLLPHVERLTWTGDLDAVRDFVARGIAEAASFDTRCRRVLKLAAEAKGLQVREVGRRRVVVEGAGTRALFEYERVLPSLERLHRLYEGYRAVRAAAVLISGEQKIPEATSEAVRWACGRAPLHVASLQDAVSFLDRLL